MKKIIFLSLLLVISSTLILAQVEMDRPFKDSQQKIDELEKLRLIEILNMDEETSVRFFARRNEHMQQQRALIFSRDSLLMEIEENFKGNDENLYKKQLNQILGMEEQIFQGRKHFYESLKDILTQEQILKIIVFEHRFKKEIRDMLFKHRGPRGMRD